MFAKSFSDWDAVPQRFLSAPKLNEQKMKYAEPCFAVICGIFASVLSSLSVSVLSYTLQVNGSYKEAATKSATSKYLKRVRRVLKSYGKNNVEATNNLDTGGNVSHWCKREKVSHSTWRGLQSGGREVGGSWTPKPPSWKWSRIYPEIGPQW